MFIHTLFVHFIPIVACFAYAKNNKKTMCVKSSVPLCFLVKRKNAQVPFVSLGNMRFRQILLVSARMHQRNCEPLIPTTSSGCGRMCMGAKVGCLRFPNGDSWMHGTRKGIFEGSLLAES